MLAIQFTAFGASLSEVILAVGSCGMQDTDLGHLAQMSNSGDTFPAEGLVLTTAKFPRQYLERHDAKVYHAKQGGQDTGQPFQDSYAFRTLPPGLARGFVGFGD